MPLLWGVQFHVWADSVAFAFALTSIILCSVQIHHHIYHNHEPETRRYIIRILLMVPVYATEAWVGLYSPEFGTYMDAIRDSYEALVIYSFYQLLICSMGGYDNVQQCLWLIPQRSIAHVWPMNYCLKPWNFADTGVQTTPFQHTVERGTFLRNCSLGVLQYCILQPLCAIAAFVMENCGVYREGSFSPGVGYPYIALIRTLSQTWAIYCLVFFYLALSKQPLGSDGQLKFDQIRPVSKFLCIKGVVFFTYWQSVAIAIFVWMGWVQSTDKWSSDNIAVGMQDFIICFEMLFAALAHIYAFRVTDFEEHAYAPLLPPHKVLFDVANVGDVVDEAKHALTSSVPDLWKFRRNAARKKADRHKLSASTRTTPALKGAVATEASSGRSPGYVDSMPTLSSSSSLEADILVANGQTKDSGSVKKKKKKSATRSHAASLLIGEELDLKAHASGKGVAVGGGVNSGRRRLKKKKTGFSSSSVRSMHATMGVTQSSKPREKSHRRLKKDIRQQVSEDLEMRLSDDEAL